jgi:hypothetical protein
MEIVCEKLHYAILHVVKWNNYICSRYFVWVSILLQRKWPVYLSKDTRSYKG